MEFAIRTRWHGRRCLKTNISQSTIAIKGLRLVDPSIQHAGDVTQAHLYQAVAMWRSAGTAPATIIRRLNCLHVLGVATKGCSIHNPKRPKWWLRPEVREQLAAIALPTHLRHLQPQLLAYVEWATLTGLRVEETLRLTRADFAADFSSVLVGGTKTSMANATLPLGDRASVIAVNLMQHSDTNAAMFTLTYDQLRDVWLAARTALGIEHRGATLKALRRTAARYLHYDRGMPLDLTRQYLRHENVQTTMEYLRLTGGASEDEMRRYL